MGFKSSLQNSIFIVDTWNLTQKRKRQCQDISQIITYSFSNDTRKIFISVIYIAPDVCKDNKDVIFAKILEYSSKFENYIICEDFNLNVNKPTNKSYITSTLNGSMTQIVNENTRLQSLIDLVFISNSMVKSYKNLTVDHNTPSDHSLVSFSIEINKSLNYSIEKFYFDPSRRPRISNLLKGKINRIMTIAINNFTSEFKKLPQSESFALLEYIIRDILDGI